MNSTLSLILIAVIPVSFSVVLYYFFHSKYGLKISDSKKQLIAGVIFGIIAICGTEFGVPLNGAVLNARDAAPLCAALIFGAPAGFISGFIGGIERWFAVYWGAGYYTRLACSISTYLTGLIGAGLRKYMFDDQMPSWIHATMIGTVCEVIHMLMIFITNMNDARRAFIYVEACTIPMVIINALAVGLAVLLIELIRKNSGLSEEPDKTPSISLQVQNNLIIVVVFSFIITASFALLLQNKISINETQNLLHLNITDAVGDVNAQVDDTLLQSNYIVADELSNNPHADMSELCERYDIAEINIINKDGIIVGSNLDENIGFDMKSGKINKQKTVSLDIDRKESAKITLKSNNSSIAKAASGDEIKLLKPGRVKITVKTKETKHYKAGSKTVTVKVKGYQVVKLTGSIVKANVNGTYTLKKDVFVLPLGVQPCDNAKYTCRIYTNGKENQAWIESGDKVTAKGCGSFRLEVKTKKTELCPAASVIIPINMAGKIKIKNSWLYRQVDKNSLELLKYIGDSGNGAFRVPASIKLDSAGKKKAVKLGASAMAGKKYTKVTIADGSMKTIGKNALKGCTSLQTLRLPVSLTTIEEGAFYGCGKLTSLELPSKVKTIGKNAFNGCKSIKGELYLPLSLTAVKEGTFKGCAKISQLFVYHNLTKVEKNAFYGCSALKDVRYSAGKAQWKKISKASGNDPFKKVKMYNMAAPSNAYPAAKITDSNLYSSHPKNLMNKSYKYAMENAEDYLMTILCKETDDNLTWSAIKTTMMNGPIENIKAIFDGYLNDGRFTEEKVEKALAMELLRDAIEEDWSLGGAGKKIKEVYDETKNDPVLTELRDKGSAIFKDNKTRYRFAQAMDKCVPGRQITKYNNMLKKIQPHWNRVQQLYKGVGKGIEAYDFAVDVIMLNVYCTENLNQLMEIIPPSTTGLYNGLKLAKLKMDNPNAAFMADMLQDEILEQFASISFDKLLEHLDVPGGATVTVATTLFKVVGACIDVPKIGAFNDAWLSMGNTRALYSAYNRMNADMVYAGNGKSYQSKHKLVLSMYFTSLEKSAGYVEKIVKDHDKSVYISEFMKRYKGGGFTYGAYVRSCKENYAEGHQ